MSFEIEVQYGFMGLFSLIRDFLKIEQKNSVMYVLSCIYTWFTYNMISRLYYLSFNN